eukprot:TRINITY_DN1662_c0_g1_i1.p1 TRINITY_DN1662_c0_g1~~TRINITY_DN1662_c0_g1_i1.p1  ORF type:complete len:142 (+),score=4.63 TRINITY_DN1662_c0_g1_i1:301-726(+)
MKGLKLFSYYVKLDLQKQSMTSHELFLSISGKIPSCSSQNAKRRLYDAINVLQSVGFVKKDGTLLSWNNSAKYSAAYQFLNGDEMHPVPSLEMPFVIISLKNDSAIQVESLLSRKTVIINSNSPFQIHDDLNICTFTQSLS